MFRIEAVKAYRNSDIMSLHAQEWDIKHCFLNGFRWSEFTEGPVMDKAQLASCTDRCTAI